MQKWSVTAALNIYINKKEPKKSNLNAGRCAPCHLASPTAFKQFLTSERQLPVTMSYCVFRLTGNPTAEYARLKESNYSFFWHGKKEEEVCKCGCRLCSEKFDARQGPARKHWYRECTYHACKYIRWITKSTVRNSHSP